MRRITRSVAYRNRHARASIAVGMMILGTVSSLGCGGEALGPSEQPAAAISMVSGDDQQVEAGRLLEPLVVRVTDAQSAGVGSVRVNWTITSGAGVFFLDARGSFRGFPNGALTDADGIARAYFSPTALGATTVAAAVVGLQGSPVTFTAAAAAPAWLPVSSSALIYERVGVPRSGVLTRYAVYDDSTFELQYIAGFEYPGTYSIGSGEIGFQFDEPDWRATGTVRGDTLLVQYNFDASLSGFEDGLYVRSSGTP